MSAGPVGSVLTSHSYSQIHIGSHSHVHNGNVYGAVTNNISNFKTTNNNKEHADAGSDRIGAAACIAGLRKKIQNLCDQFTEKAALWKHGFTWKVYAETESCGVALAHLQAHLYGKTIARNRIGLISVQDFLTALTAAVILLEEVQELVPTMHESQLEDQELPPRIEVLEKLQWQKSAWGLMVKILGCPLENQAEATGVLLANVIARRLSEDVDLAQRLETLRNELSDLIGHLNTVAGAERLYVSVLPDASASSGAHLSVAPYAFETDLLESRVYRRYQEFPDDSVDHSRKSIQTTKYSALTRYTSLTLEGSILTVIAIPIQMSQLRDAGVYRLDAQAGRAVIAPRRTDNTHRVHSETLKIDFQTSRDSVVDAPVSLQGLSLSISALAKDHITVDRTIDRAELLRDHDLNEMLFYASDKQALKDLVVQRGACVEHRDSIGRTPLMWHAKEGHDELLEALLELGALVNEVNVQHRRTALFYASNIACVRILAQQGADLAARDVHGMTPLSCHVQRGAERTATALLACGAAVDDMHPKTKRTPLFYAQSEECVKLLISHGSLVDHRDTAGNTPFLWHVHEGRQGIVQKLIDCGACDDTVNSVSGETALGIAIRRGHKNVAQVILSRLGSGA